MQEKRLHEVHTGGLSSYSVVNMVIAHLMAEGYKLHGSDSQEVNKDLGHLLWGFFTRFGKVFDYRDQAISVSQVQTQSKGAETNCVLNTRCQTQDYKQSRMTRLAHTIPITQFL